MAQEHIRRWTIGAVEVVRIVEIWEETIDDSILFQDCGAERVKRYPWLVPHYATPEGKIKMNFQAFALRAGDRKIMVDTCVGNDKHRLAPLFNHLHTSFLADLTAAGFAPESID